MKWIGLLIALSVLCFGLTYSGKSIFGMGDGMMMGDLECLNHCIDASVFPVVASSALPIILFVVCSIMIVAFRDAGVACPTPTNMSRRTTEPISILLRTQMLSTVIIRD